MAGPLIRVAFQLTGDAELDRKFTELPGRLQRKIIREALRPAAKLIRDAAAANAPRKTGLLGGSLKVRAGKRTRTGRVSMNVMTSKGWFKGADFYGAFVALGHRAGPRRLGSRRKLVPARPFLRKAYLDVGPEARDLAISLMKQGIEREWKAANGGG
jgi:HK97 gp10 family phage protein